MLEKLDFIGN